VPPGGYPTSVEEELPLPTSGAGHVQVKVSHVAQDPTDTKSFDTNSFGKGLSSGVILSDKSPNSETWSLDMNEATF
ncbi:uncharacterized protein N7515_007284, partial [Penicillium bovifimosum]